MAILLERAAHILGCRETFWQDSSGARKLKFGEDVLLSVPHLRVRAFANTPINLS